MHLVTFFAILSGSESVPQTNLSPIVVPIAILVLMVLLYVWGLTRGNVRDENMPNGVQDQLGDKEADHSSH